MQRHPHAQSISSPSPNPRPSPLPANQVTTKQLSIFQYRLEPAAPSAQQPKSDAAEPSVDAVGDTRAAGDGKAHQGMERTTWGIAEDKAPIWELKTQRARTRLWQETGEGAARDCQREEPLRTGTQPEAALSSALNREF